MNDLFSREQKILDNALIHLEKLKSGTPCSDEEFATIVREYGRILKQLRRMTKISDKTTVDLNLRKLDLQDKVNYDALTGIYNRRFLEENLNRIIENLSHSKEPLSVLMLDVDYFKKYNDTYGHSMGDECLKSIAKALSGSISRETDFVARYGGEEFIVVLPNTDEIGARSISGKILENISACNIPHEKNEAAKHVTASIGATTGTAQYQHKAESYVKLADKALYESKRNGRNRYTFINFEEEVFNDN